MVARSADTRAFVFEPTPAVVASRARTRFIDCSVCRADNSEYLFHEVGVRFVRCRTCGLVYMNPVGEVGPNYFDAAALPKHADPRDRRNLLDDFEGLLRHVRDAYVAHNGSAPKRTLLVGRYLEAYRDLPIAREMGLDILAIGDEEFAALVEGTHLEWLRDRLSRRDADVVLLDEYLEATGSPAAALEPIVAALPHAWYVVHYADTNAFPARALRRYWPHFFEHKRAYFATNNLASLMARYGFAMKYQRALSSHVSVAYALQRAWSHVPSPLALAARLPPGRVRFPMRVGNCLAMFGPGPGSSTTQRREKLSVVLPVFNEARYVAQVIDTILAKELVIPHELVIVESNSTDGTRDIVRGYEGRPNVRVVLEDAPRGKGRAVRSGLAAISGSIVLIQDADFEYDIDDYDALLEPILQHRAHFVLGSRNLGLDDWKIRRFRGSPIRKFILNATQVGFSFTFNTLYQQRTTDMGTMFKVFRRECLDGIELECDRFDLDVELVCKLVKAGYDAFEVPVNYVSRGFAEGKKVSLVRDALPCYFALFRYR